MRDDFEFSQVVATQNNLSSDLIDLFKSNPAKFEELFKSCYNKMTEKEHDVSVEMNE